MKKIIILAIGLAIAVTFVHDLGAWVTARRAVVEGSREAADVAAGLASEGERAATAAAAEVAAKRGVSVIEYRQDDTRVEVRASVEVTGTWVLAPISARIANRPAGTLPTIENLATQPVR
ncbi:MAG: hypothetical protein RBS78_01415 [Coriobacteriia bacterium]|nr:hypothetical protein [Coriobacteriia bacterium]